MPPNSKRPAFHVGDNTNMGRITPSESSVCRDSDDLEGRINGLRYPHLETRMNEARLNDFKSGRASVKKEQQSISQTDPGTRPGMVNTQSG